MPFTRPRSAADIMTRSLMPSYDAGASVLSEYFVYLYYIIHLIILCKRQSEKTFETQFCMREKNVSTVNWERREQMWVVFKKPKIQ